MSRFHVSEFELSLIQLKTDTSSMLDSASFSDQLLFSYSRVNLVDKAKYLERSHRKKTPNNKSKQKCLCTHKGEPQSVLLQVRLG